jgi:hypothetical protein
VSEAYWIFESIKELVKTQIVEGDNTVKYDLQVLVCCRCKTPVEIVNARNETYKCPDCKKLRNRQQREFMSYRSFIEYRKVGTNEYK